MYRKLFRDENNESPGQACGGADPILSVLNYTQHFNANSSCIRSLFLDENDVTCQTKKKLPSRQYHANQNGRKK